MSQPEHFDLLVLGGGQGGQLIGVRGNGSRRTPTPERNNSYRINGRAMDNMVP